MTKAIPTIMRQKLDAGVTTFCNAWVLTRKDGVVMGFTDHDSDLWVAGVLCLAEAGFTSSLAQQALGLSVDNLELVGALRHDVITETDLVAGVYDDADITGYWVDWEATSQSQSVHAITMAGNLGEVTQSGIRFTAEMRSLAHRLNQKVGRVFTRNCDAVFADSRCGVNRATYEFTATVSAVQSNGAFTLTGLDQESDYFARGVLTWITGPNTNAIHDIKGHGRIGTNTASVTLWAPSVITPTVGDTCKVLAGCGQTHVICATKFNNINNFRGFPHMPGKDIVTKYPSRDDDTNNGGSIVV